MMFVITLVHTPELCLARREFAPDIRDWEEEMNDLAAKLRIKILGAYGCPVEHTFYFILESDDFKAITDFFSGTMLTHNTGRISPVIPLKDASAALLK